MKSSKREICDYEGRMTMNNFFAVLVLAYLLTGCAPRVISDMYTYEFAPLPPDSVQVFQVDEPVPAGSIAIGTVKVVDNGLSVKGGYERVLRMAIGETARNGGNGLVVTDHRKPDMRSTIHRVWGTMLHIDQTAADTVVRASVQRALARSDYDGYKQYRNMRERSERLRDSLPRNMLRVAIGPSWLVSRYQTGHREYNSKCGLDIAADYGHYWRSGLGIGVSYLHGYTSFDEGIDMRVNYIGPYVGFAYMLGGKWRLGTGIGLGYGRYSESVGFLSHSESSLGALVRLNGEYMSSEHFGIGLQMNIFTMNLKKPDGFVLKDNEFYGIRRLGAMLALHYYF